MPKITKRLVEAAAPSAKDAFLWDDELTGYGLKVTPAGKKVFILQYRVGRQSRRMTLGHSARSHLIKPVRLRRQHCEAWRGVKIPWRSALLSGRHPSQAICWISF